MTELLRVPVSPLSQGEIVLERETGKYVTRVHRHGPGDTFLAFDPEARTEADATIVAVGRAVRCRLERVRPAKAVARTGITLVQAVGKGDKPERIVRDATALGAERIVFCLSQRTVVRPGERARPRQDRWRAIAVDACRQCGRGDAPVVDGPLPFADAIALCSPEGRRLCLAPGGATSFAAATRDWRKGEPITVLVGPEGGFDDAEIKAAAALGFEPVNFGVFVLRTETMAVAVLGALAVLSG